MYNEVHKFCDGTLKRVSENLQKMIRENMLGRGNANLKGRSWTKKDVERSQTMVNKIERTLNHKRQMRRLESFVGGRPKTMDTRLLVRHEDHPLGGDAHDEEACLEEQILSLMHRFADRFTNRRAEINRLISLPDHQLIEYGRYALGCMTGADMKKATYLKSVRDELLRSMEEKRQLIKNYKEM
ncbi:hypothetical protein Tco_1212111 [Tanacetum coccineum]